MERVRGLGGVFVRSADADRLKAWYRDHLGVPLSAWGGVEFVWSSEASDGRRATTTWSVFAQESDYFGTSGQDHMLNFRVADLDAMLSQLRALGDDVLEQVESSEYGRFGWVHDPDGRRIELWEPPLA